MFTAVTKRRAPAPLVPVDVAAPVLVDKETECHVTPSDVAARMVDYLGPCGDILTLEPSAGTGQIVRALLAAGQSRFEICQIERHIGLASKLRELGPVINRCFLEYASEASGKVQFPRVIMNPPFSKVRQHVAAALTLLGRNGHQERPVLVALVPITFEHFDAETLEELPDDTFALARVRTKIVRIYR
ncbi:MAG: methyltransferase type 11 [Beijerinckiaceae bacterium]